MYGLIEAATYSALGFIGPVLIGPVFVGRHDFVFISSAFSQYTRVLCLLLIILIPSTIRHCTYFGKDLFRHTIWSCHTVIT